MRDRPGLKPEQRREPLLPTARHLCELRHTPVVLFAEHLGGERQVLAPQTEQHADRADEPHPEVRHPGDAESRAERHVAGHAERVVTVLGHAACGPHDEAKEHLREAARHPPRVER